MTILEVGAEGGTLAVFGEKSASGKWWFWSSRNEDAAFEALSEEDRAGLEPRGSGGQIESLHAALKQLDCYPWFRMQPLVIHPEFRAAILDAVKERSSREEQTRWEEKAGEVVPSSNEPSVTLNSYKLGAIVEVAGKKEVGPGKIVDIRGDNLYILFRDGEGQSPRVFRRDARSLRLAVVQSTATLRSPVQEHHIDFLLEEEFASNTEFLEFFLRTADDGPEPGTTQPQHFELAEDRQCLAVRSVTSMLGETDVLVIYRSAHPSSPRVAILIEDKIRAGFQDDQAGRYHARGQEGVKSGLWDAYWTCLVSPAKYAKGEAGFDKRVTLEKLVSFFSEESSRSRFKARVLERAIDQASASGVQKRDERVSSFRELYAREAHAFFLTQRWCFQISRAMLGGATHGFAFEAGVCRKVW